MKHLTILIILLVVTSCQTQKKLDEICAKCPKKDSVVIKEITKITPFDTTLFLSQIGKDIMFDFSGDCCSVMDSLFAEMGRNNGVITKKENGIKSSIFKQGTKVVFRCEADSLRAVIKGLRTTIEKTKSQVKTIVLPAPKCDKPHERWYDKIARWWLLISLFIILLVLGWKFKPQLLGLFKKLLP